MRPDGTRQSDRVSLRMAVEASWFAEGGMSRTHSSTTLLVSRNGGVLCLPEKLAVGQELTLRRELEGGTWKSAHARVVAQIDQEPEGFLFAFQLLEPRPDFWDIEFPAPHKADNALARLLMECGFCQRREVVYLNPLELKSFAARKCIARVCVICGAPAVWIESQTNGSPAEKFGPESSTDSPVNPRRNRARIQARVLACVRRRGFEEEIAVCEDLSKGGISFRSRNQYPEGTRVEVAVPFTPGSSAIFVPVRIVFSTPIPAAGLFKHGGAYIKTPTA